MRTVPEDMATKLMAAADLFAERGLDGTKTDDIAAVTGVPKATIYYYFDGKEQVLSFIFGVVLDAVGSAVATAVQAPGDPGQRLRQLITAHLEVFARYPAASQALVFDLGRAARQPEVAARSNSAFITPVASLLAEGAADGTFRRLDHPKLTAVAILGAITTTAVNVFALDSDPLLEELSDVIATLVLGGIEAGS